MKTIQDWTFADEDRYDRFMYAALVMISGIHRRLKILRGLSKRRNTLLDCRLLGFQSLAVFTSPAISLSEKLRWFYNEGRIDDIQYERARWEKEMDDFEKLLGLSG